MSHEEKRNCQKFNSFMSTFTDLLWVPLPNRSGLIYKRLRYGASSEAALSGGRVPLLTLYLKCCSLFALFTNWKVS